MEDSITIITDPWSLLGVTRDDNLEDIKRQRNALALATHPDKCPSPSLRPEWTARMATINDAFALATDDAAWDAYQRQHHLSSSSSSFPDENDNEDAQQHPPPPPPQEDSPRVARARAHESTPAHSAARAARRRNLQARADAVAEENEDGTPRGAEGARARWEGYYARQRDGINSDDAAARVGAREARDARVETEARRFGAVAAVGMATEQWADAAALLEGEGDGEGGGKGKWTVEMLAAESLGALEGDEGSHKQRKAVRRMLVGEAVEKRARGQLKWEGEHGGAGAGGAASQQALEEGGARRTLRIGGGAVTEADEEAEALEEERRRHAQKLEQYAETRKFRAEWDGLFGNEAPVKKAPRPPNRKEARQMKKLKSQGKA